MNAFLILCHKNPEQVTRLAKICQGENTDVFIHADVSMNKKDFEILLNFAAENSIILTKERIHCELDHRSLVDATILLIKAAKQKERLNGKKYDYFALLSGQDYLLKPIEEIEKELSRLYPQPLIDCTPWSKTNWVSKKFSKNEKLLAFRDRIDGQYPGKKGLPYCFLRGLGFLWKKQLQFLHKADIDYFNHTGIKIYGGSAWWILPDIAVNYILKEYKGMEEYINRLLLTYTPEETFFQILTMRSEVREMVKLNPENSTNQSCKTFAYFSDAGKPFCGHPYTLTMQNAEMLLNMKDYWIARKFEINEDSDILDFIDDNLLKTRQ